MRLEFYDKYSKTPIIIEDINEIQRFITGLVTGYLVYLKQNGGNPVITTKDVQLVIMNDEGRITQLYSSEDGFKTKEIKENVPEEDK